MMKRLTQAPCHSPETSPRPSRDVPAPQTNDRDIGNLFDISPAFNLKAEQIT